MELFEAHKNGGGRPKWNNESIDHFRLSGWGFSFFILMGHREEHKTVLQRLHNIGKTEFCLLDSTTGVLVFHMKTLFLPRYRFLPYLIDRWVGTVGRYRYRTYRNV